MPKNVVVCCDGTANEFAVDRTNVIKLYSTLTQDPSTQVAYYHPGLGTMEPPGALTPWQRRVTRTLGLAFGYGLQSDLAAAYIFLMQMFDPGDKVFLFGFSRGAYTVRCLASLLHMYGLIRPGNEALVPYMIRMAMAVHSFTPKTASADARPYFDLASQFKTTMSRTDCRPWFVGVWDTVDSVGWIENPLHMPFSSSNPDIEVGRHAVSIDERRTFFRDNLWRPSSDPATSGPKDLKQVWFPGVHCDVGGGYAEAESGLSKIPLAWMLREAQAFGLLVDPHQVDMVMGIAPGSTYARADVNGPAHESLTGLWWVAEYVPKKSYNWTTGTTHLYMNKGARRFIPPGSLVHVSAFERAGNYAARLPRDVVPAS